MVEPSRTVGPAPQEARWVKYTSKETPCFAKKC